MLIRTNSEPLVKRNAKIKDSYPLKINNENRLKLRGIEIYNKLSFDKHIYNLCKKVNNQLNPIGRIQQYMGFKEKKVLVNSFVWYFCSSKSLNKIKKIQERALRLLYNDFVSDYSGLLNKIRHNYKMTIKRFRYL